MVIRINSGDTDAKDANDPLSNTAHNGMHDVLTVNSTGNIVLNTDRVRVPGKKRIQVIKTAKLLLLAKSIPAIKDKRFLSVMVPRSI